MVTRAQTGHRVARRLHAEARCMRPRSPGAEPRPTEMRHVQLPGTVTVGGASASRPCRGGVEDDASTLHVPAPPPASSRRTTVCVSSCPRAMRPNESAVGLAKRSGRSAALQRDHASPLESRAGAVRRLVDRIHSRLHERRLQLLHRPRGMSLARSAAAPATCGAAMLVPENSAQPPPGTDESTLDSRSGDVGLEAERNRRRPDGRERGCVVGSSSRLISTAPTAIASAADLKERTPSRRRSRCSRCRPP